MIPFWCSAAGGSHVTMMEVDVTFITDACCGGAEGAREVYSML